MSAAVPPAPAGWEGRVAGVYGLGKSGAAAARLLRENGAEVRLFDDRDPTPARLSALGLAAFAPPVAPDAAGFAGLDELVVSPGVPPAAPGRGLAAAAGLPVRGELELGLAALSGRVTVVTGSHGKSTVTTWLAALLRARGREAVACGNLGTPPCELALAGTDPEEVVVEASSFQLHDARDLEADAAVFTAYAPNHLDWHPDEADYIRSKLALVARLRPGAPVAYLPGFPGLDAALAARGDLAPRPVGPRGEYGYGEALPGEVRTPTGSVDLAALPGGSRLVPLAPAIALAAAGAGAAAADIRAAADTPPLPHRLEELGIVAGRRFVNDSKATTPAASAYSVARVPGPVVLVLGGKDKGLSFGPFKDALAGAHRLVFTGAARPRLLAELGDLPHDEAAGFEDALALAVAACPEGGAVLLAPGCSSFDRFENYEARGEAFRAFVGRLGRGEEAA